MSKTKDDDAVDELRRDFRRLERILLKGTTRASRSPPRGRRSRRSRYRTPSATDSARSRSTRTRSRSRSRSRSPIITIIEEEEENGGTTQMQLDDVKDDKIQAEEDISEDILALLGEAPETVECGPDLLNQLATRWQDIVKNGLNKDIKKKLMKKYPVPGNCKILEAPKLNPEAQAAAENTVKKDKAIEYKQQGVSCALTAIGLALNKICKTGDETVITLLSDSARLLCDYLYTESCVRKQFILASISNKSAREAMKATEVDQWLFSEKLNEKLKASKAIERSGKDIKGTNRPKKYQSNNLNFKGPANNTFKPRSQGQKPAYQSHQKKPANTSTKSYQQKTPRSHHYAGRR